MSDWELAAQLALRLAYARHVAGADVYAPAWYKRAGPTLGLGDGGAIEAIKSGDPARMRAALDELEKFT